MSKLRAVLAVTLISLALLILAAACGGGGEENPFGLESELVTAARRPAALAFAPDGRLFFVEKDTGDIRIVNRDGELLPEPFAHVDVLSNLEWGATGLALDPQFETNHYVYVFFTEAVDVDIGRPVITRFTDRANRGIDAEVIVGDLPEVGPGNHHNGNGAIQFGPDGFLYFTLGDFDLDTEQVRDHGAQELDKARGKIFRVDKEDGSAPPDNPFSDEPDADPRIFAYGFREPFDFAFHPQTGQVYGTDNTPGNCEELNLIEAGGNYGWPDVGEFPWPDCFAGEQVLAIHFFAQEEYQPSRWASFVVVSGVEFVSGDVYPLLGDGLLVCEIKTQLMRRLVLGGTNFDQVTQDDIVVEDCNGDIAVSPDGIIYYSDLDPARFSTDDEIRRLVPIEPEPEES